MNPTINVNWVPGITLDEMEKQCILAALRFYRGNKTLTSQVLGIAIRTLDNKLERYDADARKDQERRDLDTRERAAILARHRGIDITQQNAVGSSNQIQKNETHGDETDSGVHIQPTFKAAEKQSVPMSQHKEVQSVLSKQVSAHSQRRGR